MILYTIFLYSMSLYNMLTFLYIVCHYITCSYILCHYITCSYIVCHYIYITYDVQFSEFQRRAESLVGVGEDTLLEVVGLQRFADSSQPLPDTISPYRHLVDVVVVVHDR